MYSTASEVVREALRGLKEREDYRRQKLEELRREVQKGLDSLNRGEGIEFNEAYVERLKSEIRRRVEEENRRRAAS